MVASRLPATLLRLHEVWAAAFAADPTVNVWLGQVATGDPTDALWIGWDGDLDGNDQMAAARSAWAGLGARRRNEELRIVSVITALQGLGSDAGGVEAVITRVYGLLDTAEAALRTDPSLGQGPPYVAAVSGTDLHLHPQADQGLLARLVITVTVASRT